MGLILGLILDFILGLVLGLILGLILNIQLYILVTTISAADTGNHFTTLEFVEKNTVKVTC